MNKNKMGSAVVLGSGMAGLVTARVLSEFFDRVTIFEKDQKQDAPGFRAGAPQGRHFHALIPGGLEIMEELLPGLKADLRAAGSLLPEPDQFYFYLPEGKSYAQGAYQPKPPRADIYEPSYVQTRGLLEFTVRSRVEALNNVEVRYDTSVKDVVTDTGRVTAVVIERTGERVSADLVIDALGKGGRSLAWLDAMGFDRPVENIINCDFAYTSVFLEPDDPDAFTDVGFFVAPNPTTSEHMRAGALVRMEDGSWLALVGGRYGDFPPRDFDGFMEYAETIAEPRFHALLKQATLIGDPAHYRFPKGTRRRFDQLQNFPEGLLPIGDSVCHFNPAYGQGMSSACRQAMALRRELEQHRDAGSVDGLWRSVFPAIYQETRAPWLIAAVADFTHPKCTGDFPEEEQPSLAAIGQLTAMAGQKNVEAARLLTDVFTLKLPLSALLESELVADDAQAVET